MTNPLRLQIDADTRLLNFFKENDAKSTEMLIEECVSASEFLRVKKTGEKESVISFSDIDSTDIIKDKETVKKIFNKVTLDDEDFKVLQENGIDIKANYPRFSFDALSHYGIETRIPPYSCRERMEIMATCSTLYNQKNSGVEVGKQEWFEKAEGDEYRKLRMCQAVTNKLKVDNDVLINHMKNINCFIIDNISNLDKDAANRLIARVSNILSQDESELLAKDFGTPSGTTEDNKAYTERFIQRKNQLEDLISVLSLELKVLQDKSAKEITSEEKFLLPMLSDLQNECWHELQVLDSNLRIKIESPLIAAAVLYRDFSPYIEQLRMHVDQNQNALQFKLLVQDAANNFLTGAKDVNMFTKMFYKPNEEKMKMVEEILALASSHCPADVLLRTLQSEDYRTIRPLFDKILPKTSLEEKADYSPTRIKPK